jgi:hypothetical protein
MTEKLNSLFDILLYYIYINRFHDDLGSTLANTMINMISNIATNIAIKMIFFYIYKYKYLLLNCRTRFD